MLFLTVTYQNHVWSGSSWCLRRNNIEPWVSGGLTQLLMKQCWYEWCWRALWTPSGGLKPSDSSWIKKPYAVWIVYIATHLLLELTVWYLTGNSRMAAASTGLPHRKKNLRLTAACIRLSNGVLNACLIPIWKQPSDGRLYTAASRYIEQPPDIRLQMAAWRVKKQLSHSLFSQPFPNGSLAENSSRSYLAGGTILAM